MDTPRTLSLAGTAHPKALVQHIDPANGILMFAWLDANGNRVDSGNSGARFTPQSGAEQPDGTILYDEVDDAVLIDAIENPAPVEPGPVRLTPLEVIGRLTQAEEVALTTSTDLSVAIVRQRFIAATYIDSSDPRTAEGIAVLVSKGIISAERAGEIFS